MRSYVIEEELELLHVKKSQMRWFGHLVRMPLGLLPGKVFRARLSVGKTPEMLKRLSLPGGLGTTWNPPAGAGQSSWDEESLVFPA